MADPACEGTDMARSANLSFKWKLTLSLMLTSIISLLTACATFFFYDNYLFRQSMVKELQTTANVISAASQAAMKIRDKASVDKALEALKDKEQIVAAVVYDNFERPLS